MREPVLLPLVLQPAAGQAQRIGIGLRGDVERVLRIEIRRRGGPDRSRLLRIVVPGGFDRIVVVRVLARLLLDSDLPARRAERLQPGAQRLQASAGKIPGLELLARQAGDADPVLLGGNSRHQRTGPVMGDIAIMGHLLCQEGGLGRPAPILNRPAGTGDIAGTGPIFRFACAKKML
ncbi:hypothetical protein U1769_02020 [Sphingomonas sp. ZT3P38]